MMIDTTTSTQRYKEVWEGIEFAMEMFKDPRFPRTILTGASHKPHIVKSRKEAMNYFHPAMYEDCYMNAYLNYDAIGISGPKTLLAPNHLMIDLDGEPFGSNDMAAEQALTDTLQNIKANITGISGEHPIVIASGSKNSYHIHVPLPGLRMPLQQMPEFEAFKDDTELNNKFLRYAERRLTNYKADQRHSPSVLSNMFRIPGTVNTKARDRGVKNPTVRIVQGWEHAAIRAIEEGLTPTDYYYDVVASKPTTKFLHDFYIYLVQEKIDEKAEQLGRQWRKVSSNNDGNNNNSLSWIDKLLQTPVQDNRKNLIFWVLAPYLITIRKLDSDRAYTIIESWLHKCSEIRRLEPDWNSFRYRIRQCLDAAERQERKPIRFETFKEYYPDVYKQLSKLGRCLREKK